MTRKAAETPPAKKAPAKKAPPKKTAERGLIKPSETAKKAVRKTPVKKAVEVVEPEPLAYETARVGNRSYPVYTDPNCVVCTHPKRALIEEQILLHTQYTAIAKEFSGHVHRKVDGTEQKWPTVTADHVSAHFNNDHSPLDAYLVRDLREQQVDLAEYEKVGTRLVNGLAFAHRVIGRVEERMVRGEIEPTFKDATAMTRITTAVAMASAEADYGDEQDQSWFYEQSFDVFFNLAKKIMTKEQHSQFMDELRADPTLRALYERRDNPKLQEKSA